MAFVLTLPTSGTGGIANECFPFFRSDGVLDTITIVSDLLPFYRSDGTFDPIFMEKCSAVGGNLTTWGSIVGTLSNQTDLQTAFDGKVSKSGDTMTGVLTIADLPNAITSVNYPVQINSGITSTGTSVGHILDTTNNLNTNGDKIFSVRSIGNERFYVGRENGAWGTKIQNHLAIGKSTLTVPQFSLLKIDDTMVLSSFGQQGDGIDLDVEMNISTVFVKAAAFNGKATVTGPGALPFISGMLFEIDQQGTGTWGANPGSWGQSPSVVAARWSSQAGASNFGNWAAVFTAFGPSLATGGGVRPGDGTYIGFEAISGQATAQNLHGMYIWPQTTTGIATGLFVGKSSGDVSSRGIVLSGDGTGADIVFGAGQDANIYFDGTDLLINSAGNISLTAPPVFPPFSVAGLPAAAPAGQQIFVTDEVGGAVMAFSDGTDWRRCTDRAIVA